MDIFSSEILENTVLYPIVEKITVDENNYVIYMAIPTGEDTTKCAIKRVTYVKNGTSESWITQYPQGSKRAEYDWDLRTEYTYKQAI